MARKTDFQDNLPHPTPPSPGCGIQYPVEAKDQQTLGLIGTAKKIDKRCAECTRPLVAGKTAKSGVITMFCLKCEADAARESNMSVSHEGVGIGN